MAEEGLGDQPQEGEHVLFYARAQYSYQPVDDTEIGFEDAGILLFLLFSILHYLRKTTRRGCICD